jgi:hypothetical protein
VVVVLGGGGVAGPATRPAFTQALQEAITTLAAAAPIRTWK